MVHTIHEPAARRLLGAVRQQASEHQLLASSVIIVAVSGGQDSVCLLDLLTLLCSGRPITLHVAHFNHRLRGEASDADEAFVATLADGYGLAFTAGSGEVAGAATVRRVSLESAAHDLRWAFFEALRRRIGADVIATGHTCDDRAESVLLHLIRGTGLAGLAALPPRVGRVIHPLLPLTRQETRQWCKLRHLDWRHDQSNDEAWCRRNAVRLTVMPVLRALNPSIEQALSRLAMSASIDESYFEQQAQVAFRLVVPTSGEMDVPRLSLAHYAEQHPAIRRRMLRLWLGASSEVESSHYERVDALLLSGRAGDRLYLPGERLVVRQYSDAVLLRAHPREQLVPPPETILNAEGTTQLPSWNLTAELQRVLPGNHPPVDGWYTDLNARVISLPLRIRSRRPGDRIELPGGRHKKVQDALVDAKVPRDWRAFVAVVTDSTDRIICLAGIGTAAWAAARPGEAQRLRLILQGGGLHSGGA